MRKLVYLTIVVAIAAFVAVPAFAQSSKFAAQVKDLTIIEATAASAPAIILDTTIKTANKKDLLLGVSLQTGLFTRTKVKGKLGEKDTSKAGIVLKIGVEIDGGVGPQPSPAEVIFDRRVQTLSATFGGVIESCEDTDNFTGAFGDECVGEGTGADGIITVKCECIVTDEDIELILDTTAAHHFNFVAANLSPGVHTVDVTAEIAQDDGSPVGDATATAVVGPGSLTVEEVRATNSPDGIELLD